ILKRSPLANLCDDFRTGPLFANRLSPGAPSTFFCLSLLNNGLAHPSIAKCSMSMLGVMVMSAGSVCVGEHEEKRGVETSGPYRIRQLGEKAPQPSSPDGWLSVLPILTGGKGGPSRFPWRLQQVGNRSPLGFRAF